MSSSQITLPEAGDHLDFAWAHSVPLVLWLLGALGRPRRLSQWVSFYPVAMPVLCAEYIKSGWPQLSGSRKSKVPPSGFRIFSAWSDCAVCLSQCPSHQGRCSFCRTGSGGSVNSPWWLRSHKVWRRVSVSLSGDSFQVPLWIPFWVLVGKSLLMGWRFGIVFNSEKLVSVLAGSGCRLDPPNCVEWVHSCWWRLALKHLRWESHSGNIRLAGNRPPGVMAVLGSSDGVAALPSASCPFLAVDGAPHTLTLISHQFALDRCCLRLLSLREGWPSVLCCWEQDKDLVQYIFPLPVFSSYW